MTARELAQRMALAAAAWLPRDLAEDLCNNVVACSIGEDALENAHAAVAGRRARPQREEWSKITDSDADRIAHAIAAEFDQHAVLRVEDAVDAVLFDLAPATLTEREVFAIHRRAERCASTISGFEDRALRASETQRIANNVVTAALRDRALGRLERVVTERMAS